MNDPPIKIFLRSKMNEATVTKTPTETQATRKKLVETRATQTKKQEKTEA
jgi:hypothetical protein